VVEYILFDVEFDVDVEFDSVVFDVDVEFDSIVLEVTFPEIL
jgi:hypothetical protein